MFIFNLYQHVINLSFLVVGILFARKPVSMSIWECDPLEAPTKRLLEWTIWLTEVDTENGYWNV